MTTGRFRLRYQFWLDVNKPDEFQLSEEIEVLKERRSFAKTVRDGIRLIVDLRKGNTDVLFELFPGIAAKLKADTADAIYIEKIESRLDALLHAQQRNRPAGLMAAPVDLSRPVVKPQLVVTEAAPSGEEMLANLFTAVREGVDKKNQGNLPVETSAPVPVFDKKPEAEKPKSIVEIAPPPF